MSKSMRIFAVWLRDGERDFGLVKCFQSRVSAEAYVLQRMATYEERMTKHEAVCEINPFVTPIARARQLYKICPTELVLEAEHD